jgi:hypothetical protein
MIGHEHNVVNKKVIFFMGFLEGTKDNTSELPLIEPEGSVVSPTDQMVGVYVLDDPQWTSHT